MAGTLNLGPMTAAEKFALKDCEQKIERGLKQFVIVGNALAEIKESYLYRETHATFVEYCQERWGFRKTRVYELIEAAKVAENVRHAGQTLTADHPNLPELTARSATELARLPAEEQPEAAAEARERFGTKPTAKQVAEVVNERLADEPDQVHDTDSEAGFEEELDEDVEPDLVDAPAPKPTNTLGEFIHQIRVQCQRYLDSQTTITAAVLADHLENLSIEARNW